METHVFVVILASMFGPQCHSAPAYGRQYEVGQLYTYDYETHVLLNEPQAVPVSTSKDVGFKVEMNVELTPVWQHPSNAHEQILQIKINVPKLSVKARQGPTPDGFANKASRVDGYKMHPLYLYWNNGQIKKMYHVDKEDLSVLNIKKGLASLLQHQLKSGILSEVDASGKCDVTYKLSDSSHLTKTKRNCKTVNPVIYFNQTNKVLSAYIESQAVTTYELNPDDKIIKVARGIETHFLRIEARRQSGAEVMSKQLLQFKSQTKYNNKNYKGNTAAEAVRAISSKLKHTLVTDELATYQDPKECIACKTLKELVANFRNSLTSKSLGSQSSAIAFVRILRKVRDSDMETIKAVLKDKHNSKIILQLIDIVAAAQTIHSHKAALAILNFNGQIELPERYLLSLSLTTHTPEFIIQDLVSVLKKGIKDEKLHETLILTVASCSHTFCKISGNCEKQVISEVRNIILNELDSCLDESCQLRYIRALKNLRLPNTMLVLLKFAEGNSRKPAIYAVRAIQTMPDSYVTEEVRIRLERIFLELRKRHDTSVRAIAADVLLRQKPSESLFHSILQILSYNGTKELNTLILGRIRDLSETDAHIQKLLRQSLRSSNYGNYHILSQNGLSSAFSRPLSIDRSANSTFSNMLEISGGLLKRSTVDVFVDSQDARMRLLSFGIFAGGLSMFGGDDAEDDGEEANAGIEITLMDTQLRPYTFFTGQGELMGHVWSGTASERTTALQGSVLLQDHSQVVPLQNGLSADLILTGAISYDFSGQVQVSLWNRNAHSLVEVGAAVVIQGQVRVDNSFVQTLVEFNTGAQVQLNFITDLDFNDEVVMCLQMVQPNFEVVTNVRKLERIPGSNYVLRKYKRKISPVPGKTYVMNRKNTELCNIMFNKQNY